SAGWPPARGPRSSSRSVRDGMGRRYPADAVGQDGQPADGALQTAGSRPAGSEGLSDADGYDFHPERQRDDVLFDDGSDPGPPPGPVTFSGEVSLEDRNGGTLLLDDVVKVTAEDRDLREAPAVTVATEFGEDEL